MNQSSTMDKFYDLVEQQVKAQMEKEEWDKVVEGQFDELCRALFQRVKRLFQPLMKRLDGYSQSSVLSVFEVHESDGNLTLRVGQQKLSFISKHANGQWEIVIKNDDRIVKSFTVIQDALHQRPAFSVISYHARTPDIVEDGHIIELIQQVFLDGQRAPV